MSNTTKIAWEPLRSLDSATFSGSYLALGGPLAHPSYILKMVNDSNILVTVSVDGATDIDVCPGGSFWLYDESKYGTPSVQFLPQGTQIYVKGATGIGLVYLVSQYIITE